MQSKNGFTLIEVLFVLALWSVLLLISAPLQFSILEKQEEDNFMDTFEMDLLYMQNKSYGSRNYFRLIFTENKSYTITKNSNLKILIERRIPKGWKIDYLNLQVISFNHRGTIVDPGSFMIQTINNNYKVTCPLGKGRCYIVKQ
ncbi:competence protein ComGD [Virgibacillus subterraneus]|uniref:Competence protein ComGD n=2 Tax=Virgibacillus TaxID=84406 RepID=A0A1H1BEX3_9BACI|nr:MULTISPECIES: competence type IV pilus minor pilin ComGD [Virgibacillus]SDQ50519.1 competence protein ComGD [Virgibacillus salinus]SEQ19524.1 competence protein ComGD [Virgibacillus subterraneus]